MLHHSPANMLPPIIVSETEEHLLTLLATGAELTRRSEDVARTLLSEMERADVMADEAMPENVVRMSSRVEFEIDGEIVLCVGNDIIIGAVFQEGGKQELKMAIADYAVENALLRDNITLILGDERPCLAQFYAIADFGVTFLLQR